jgi:hypothetical protein
VRAFDDPARLLAFNDEKCESGKPRDPKFIRKEAEAARSQSLDIMPAMTHGAAS